jgi:hypothetical protein
VGINLFYPLQAVKHKGCRGRTTLKTRRSSATNALKVEMQVRA